MLDFIRWAHKKAPAERYALVIWNHGSGWDPLDFDELYTHVKGAGVTPRELGARAASQLGRSLFTPTLETALTLPTAGARAIASDDGTGHSLDTIELGNVLAKTRKLLGQPLDLLGMDACLMSCLEVAFQSAGDVRAIVSSEELEPGDGWPYDTILADLRSKPAMDGAALGRVVVKRYIESYKDAHGPVAGDDVRRPQRRRRGLLGHARRVHDGAAPGDQGRRRRRRAAAARAHPQRPLRRRPDRPQDVLRAGPLAAVRGRGQDAGQEGAGRARSRAATSWWRTRRSARRSSAAAA